MQRVEWVNDLRVVLIEPDIPQNTGTIARLCVATQSTLHLVGRLGFHLDDHHVRRAGLDYWQYARIERHVDFPACRAALPDHDFYFFSAHATALYSEVRYRSKTAFVLGSETRGLPPSVIEQSRNEGRLLNVPILDSRVRSLNVATVAGIVIYEAIRQLGATSSAE